RPRPRSVFARPYRAARPVVLLSDGPDDQVERVAPAIAGIPGSGAATVARQCRHRGRRALAAVQLDLPRADRHPPGVAAGGAGVRRWRDGSNESVSRVAVRGSPAMVGSHREWWPAVDDLRLASRLAARTMFHE